MKRTIAVRVNGIAHEHEVSPRLLLVHYLRGTLGLTGTHIGCETSQCGTCTIILNGRSAKACTVLAVQADGADLLTVEGLAARTAPCTPCRPASARSTACSAASAPPAC